jgi:hypothetical protein
MMVKVIFVMDFVALVLGLVLLTEVLVTKRAGQ